MFFQSSNADETIQTLIGGNTQHGGNDRQTKMETPPRITTRSDLIQAKKTKKQTYPVLEH